MSLAKQSPSPADKPANVLVIVGPTAVGKTKLSLNLANRFDGEIISADSRLFYRGMDIGTAKPKPAEQAQVPHHLVDICEPDEVLTLAQFQRLVYATIRDVLERGRLPILVGGTGQYVMAVIEGWGIPEVAPQPELRTELERMDSADLVRWLTHLDPSSAARIEGPNRRRLIRALEVTIVTGQPISSLQTKTPPPFEFLIIGLHRTRQDLYSRIDERIEQMMKNGLLEEVAALQERGYERHLPSMSGLGYRQLLAYLEGEMTLEEAVERIEFDTHRFARQQSNWFRKSDPRIHWYEASNPDATEMIGEQVAGWMHGA